MTLYVYIGYKVVSNHKALAKLSNKVGFNVPTLLDPTLLDDIRPTCFALSSVR